MAIKKLKYKTTFSWLENQYKRSVTLKNVERHDEILIFNSSKLCSENSVDLHYTLQGEYADLRLLIIFLDDLGNSCTKDSYCKNKNSSKISPKSNQCNISFKSEQKIILKILHNSAHTTAKISVRAIMNGYQSLHFPATVFVPNTAAYTDTYLRCDALMLKHGSFFRPIPSLEILANEVKAGHAASASPPDEESLFFLQSRGIPEKDAKNMLITSFLNGGLSEVQFLNYQTDNTSVSRLELQKKLSALSRGFIFK